MACDTMSGDCRTHRKKARMANGDGGKSWYDYLYNYIISLENVKSKRKYFQRLLDFKMRAEAEAGVEGDDTDDVIVKKLSGLLLWYNAEYQEKWRAMVKAVNKGCGHRGTPKCINQARYYMDRGNKMVKRGGYRKRTRRRRRRKKKKTRRNKRSKKKKRRRRKRTRRKRGGWPFPSGTKWAYSK